MRAAQASPAMAAANFQTPTLVLHGEKDYRVPYTQGLNLYGVLQGKGVPARIVVFPDENHWILKPQAALRLVAGVLRLARTLGSGEGTRSRSGGRRQCRNGKARSSIEGKPSRPRNDGGSGTTTGEWPRAACCGLRAAELAAQATSASRPSGRSEVAPIYGAFRFSNRPPPTLHSPPPAPASGRSRNGEEPPQRQSSRSLPDVARDSSRRWASPASARGRMRSIASCEPSATVTRSATRRQRSSSSARSRT